MFNKPLSITELPSHRGINSNTTVVVVVVMIIITIVAMFSVASSTPLTVSPAAAGTNSDGSQRRILLGIDQ